MTAGRRLPWVTIAICVLTMAAIAAGLFLFGPSAWVMLSGDRAGRAYYTPSESMRPTLNLNDRIAPLTPHPELIRRGAVIVFRTPSIARVDRIAAVGGDTIAMRGGVVIVNGQAVQQRPVGAGPLLENGTRTRLLLERLPGEGHWHRILDIGQSFTDDQPPVHVTPGHLFVLGDNRDESADSRLREKEGGAGLVAVDDVIGVVDTLMWSHDRARIGQPIDEIDPAGKATS